MYYHHCGRVDEYDIATGSTGFVIYLDAHPLATEHLAKMVGGQPIRMPSGHQWPDAIVVNRPPTGNELDLIVLLTEALIMAPPKAVDLALALDWYQIAPGEDGAWHYTPIGQVLHSLKYEWWRTPPEIEALQEQVAQAMATVVRRHPSFAGASAIVTVPGHVLRNVGHAEQIAHRLSALTGRPLVRTLGKTLVRPERKEGAEFDLTDEFFFDSGLTRTVIVVDDLYRKGETVSAVGLAARRAGARQVLVLAGARTMRN